MKAVSYLTNHNKVDAHDNDAVNEVPNLIDHNRVDMLRNNSIKDFQSVFNTNEVETLWDDNGNNFQNHMNPNDVDTSQDGDDDVKDGQNVSHHTTRQKDPEADAIACSQSQDPAIIQKLHDHHILKECKILDNLKDIHLSNLDILQQVNRAEPAVKRLTGRSQLTMNDVNNVSIDEDIRVQVHTFLQTNVTGNYLLTRVLRENYSTFHSWLCAHLQCERNAWASRLKNALEMIDTERRKKLELSDALADIADRTQCLLQTCKATMFNKSKTSSTDRVYQVNSKCPVGPTCDTVVNDSPSDSLQCRFNTIGPPLLSSKEYHYPEDKQILAKLHASTETYSGSSNSSCRTRLPDENERVDSNICREVSSVTSTCCQHHKPECQRSNPNPRYTGCGFTRSQIQDVDREGAWMFQTDREDAVYGCTSFVIRGKKDEIRQTIIRGKEDGIKESVIKGTEDGIRQSVIRGNDDWIRKSVIRGNDDGIKESVIMGKGNGIRHSVTEGVADGFRQSVTEGVEDGIRQSVTEGVEDGISQSVIRGTEDGISQDVSRWRATLSGCLNQLSTLCQKLISEHLACCRLAGIDPGRGVSLAEAVLSMQHTCQCSWCHTQGGDQLLKVLQQENRNLLSEVGVLKNRLVDKNAEISSLQRRIEKLEGNLKDTQRTVGADDTRGPSGVNYKHMNKKGNKTTKDINKMYGEPPRSAQTATSSINSINLVESASNLLCPMLQCSKMVSNERVVAGSKKPNKGNSRVAFSEEDNKCVKETVVPGLPEAPQTRLQTEMKGTGGGIGNKLVVKCEATQPNDRWNSVITTAKKEFSERNKTKVISGVVNQQTQWRSPSSVANDGCQLKDVANQQNGSVASFVAVQHTPGLVDGQGVREGQTRDDQQTTKTSNNLSTLIPCLEFTTAAVNEVTGKLASIEANRHQRRYTHSSTGSSSGGSTNSTRSGQGNVSVRNRVEKTDSQLATKRVLQASVVSMVSSLINDSSGVSSRLGQPGKAAVSKCLRCQRLFSWADNNKLACSYHREALVCSERCHLSGRVVQVSFQWPCCSQPENSQGCCFGQHI